MAGKKKELTDHQRHNLILLLSQHVDHDNKSGLERGTIKSAAKVFNIDRKTVSRLWREAQIKAHGIGITGVVHNPQLFASKKHLRGRRQQYDRNALREQVRSIPFKDRRNFRQLATATGVSKTLLFNMMKIEKIFKRHSSALKPTLTDEQKVARYNYCLEEIHPRVRNDGKKHFKDMFDRVDVDKKWFYMSRW